MIFWPLFWHWVLIIVVILVVIGVIAALCNGNDDFEAFVLIEAFFDALSDFFDNRW
jgi:hypothetical protein